MSQHKSIDGILSRRQWIRTTGFGAVAVASGIHRLTTAHSASDKNFTAVGRQDTHDVVFTIPIGEQGVSYQAVGITEMRPWGPAALATASDGTFWVADTGKYRLLHYTAKGGLIEITDLSQSVVGIADITTTKDGTFVLDGSAAFPTIIKIGLDRIQTRHELPEGLRVTDGLSGVTSSDTGEVLVKQYGGATLSRFLDANSTVAPAQIDAPIFGGRSFKTVPVAPGAKDRKSGAIIVGGKNIAITVANDLAALQLLHVNSDGSFYALVSELICDPSIRVDQVVHSYSPSGVLLGVARLPEQYLYVQNGLAVGPDNAVYLLVTKPDRAEIQRLRFRQNVQSVMSIAENSARNSRLTSLQSGYSIMACQSRDTMISIASSYVGNSKSLNTSNTDGACSGRGKPRYLGAAGTYISVAYDWGGFDSVSGYNGFMDPGTAQAGDIDTNNPATSPKGVESCSKGVDCSGFVSRCWGRTTKWGTGDIASNANTTLLSGTNQLQKGDVVNQSGNHTAMFSYATSNGAMWYESTTFNNYDRVILTYHDWSYYGGYEPRKYNGVC